ncbi:MAG: hypothetical protein RPU64_16220 [Candidatus Sedimenticola sp. (ex Thyasira tokunagai)]
MKKSKIFLTAMFFVMLPILSACDNSEKTSETMVEKKTEAVDACSLLTQEEVDGLFTESPGPGGVSSPTPNIQGCVWPAEGISSLILQVLSAPASVRSSIDMGDGYRVIDVEGLSGQAAAAIQQENPEYGIASGLAIFGIVKDDYMVTLSPVRLNIKEGSPQFELLKELANSAAQRL